MNLDKEICEKVASALRVIEDVDVILFNDNREERTDNMIVVGISDIEQVNFALPDYSMKMEVVIDTFILDDENAEKFNRIKEEAFDILCNYFNKERPLAELFGELPVVGFIFDGGEISMTEASNRLTMNFRVITSE